MSSTSKVLLAVAPAWTEITTHSTNVLVVGISGRFEVFIGQTPPTSGTPGLPVMSLDGAFATSAMVGGDILYARPFGAFAGVPLTLSLIKS